MSERREVRVGDEHYVLRPFRGFKAVLVLERITRLLDVLPEIQSDARAEFRRQRDDNVIEIDRAVFEFRYPEDAKQISDKAWAEAGQKIKLPDEMPFDTAAVVMAVLPKVLQHAQTDVVEILALVVMDDRDLRRFDEEDTVAEEVRKLGKKLLHDGLLEELADLGAAAFAQVQDLNSGKVKVLFEQVSQLLSPDMLEEDDDPLPIPETESSEDSSETSFISSHESTDGPESKPSGSDSVISSPTPAG